MQVQKQERTLRKYLGLASTSAAAIVAAFAAHGLTASSSHWYLRTFAVIVTSCLAAWSVGILFREKA